jgi:heptosyltransferase-1
LLPNNQATPRRIHAIARTRLLTAKLLDYQNHQPAQVDFQDLPTQTGDHQTMMLTHGTTRSDNEWPLASWIELVAKCVVAGYRIVVPQANDAELQFAKALQKQFPEQLQILPRLNLSQLLDEMVLCTGVIGVDAGPSHMAVALGLPHVQIFSHDRAWRAGPLPLVDGGAQHQVAVGGTYVPSVDQVWQAWLKASSC